MAGFPTRPPIWKLGAEPPDPLPEGRTLPRRFRRLRPGPPDKRMAGFPTRPPIWKLGAEPPDPLPEERTLPRRFRRLRPGPPDKRMAGFPTRPPIWKLGAEPPDPLPEERTLPRRFSSATAFPGPPARQTAGFPTRPPIWKLGAEPPDPLPEGRTLRRSRRGYVPVPDSLPEGGRFVERVGLCHGRTLAQRFGVVKGCLNQNLNCCRRRRRRVGVGRGLFQSVWDARGYLVFGGVDVEHDVRYGREQQVFAVGPFDDVDVVAAGGQYLAHLSERLPVL